MNQKHISTFYLLLLMLATILSLYIPKYEAVATDKAIIPNEAIRLRILANSDSPKDQQIKQKVRDQVNEEITKWVEDLTSLEDAKNLIQAKLPEIQTISENVLKKEKVDQTVQVEFTKVSFPTKLYGEFLYPAGEYDAVLITIGEGKGANWWCVLFPPLCFLDFSNGVAVKSVDVDEKEMESDKQEEKKHVFAKEDERPSQIKFFIAELFKKFFR